MTDNAHYFDYLKGRSRLGLLYRQYWLYPKLCRHVTGVALDVGCGIGDFLRFRPNTIGVDVNPLVVDWCRLQGLDARLMLPDQLPFDDACFDCVVLDNVLEHLLNPQSLLAEARRILKPKGRLLIGVPGRRGYASDPDHKMFYDEAGLVSTLAQAHFALMRMFCMPFRSAWFDAYLRPYCIYGVFQRG